MMKKLAVLCMVLAIPFACQKKNNSDSTSNSQSQTTTTGGTTAGGTTGGTPVQYQADLIANNYGGGAGYSTSSSLMAYFYDTNGNKINVGVVSLNDTVLNWITLGSNYMKYSGTHGFSNPQVWKVYGGNGISSTTVTGVSIPNTPPVVSSATVIESQNFTYTHIAVPCDTIIYGVGSYTVKALGTSTSITVPASAVVSTNTIGTSVTVGIQCLSWQVQMVNSKPWRFRTSSSKSATLPYKQ